MQDIFGLLSSDPIYGKIATILIGIVVINIIVHFFQRLVTRYISDSDTSYGIRRALTFVGYVLIVLFIVSVIGNQINSLAVTLGVAGAGIAFALQEVIVSIAGWFAISFGHYFRIGDRIEINNVKGDVIAINVLRTTLMEIQEWVDGDQYNGRIVFVPNSAVFSGSIFNYTRDFPFLWDEIKVPIKYGSDYALARQIITQVAEGILGDYADAAHEQWKKMTKKYAIEPAIVTPMVTMVANDNWVEFTLRYVVDYKKRRTTKDQLFTQLLTDIEQTGGKVGIASMTIHLVEMPKMEVKLRQDKES
ncbi:MAG: mechanosensitive ion channel domain-containing protein [Anaerolineae bacterium]|jgi:small-conductance mechanosensitive channel|nr:mechanosensitive ion channel domain-containing protein [Anaerolineae bacterium]